jgi:hypothetical protein
MSSQTEATRIHFLLWQSQMWIHRRCLLAYFDKEIEYWEQNGEYEKMKYIQSMRESFANLQPENGKELK